MKINTENIGKFLEDILTLRYFEKDPEYGNTPAIYAKLYPGESKLVVISGDNASGKSFMRRLVSVACHQEKIEAIALSQESRQGGMGNDIVRGLIYGTEHEMSTGHNSANVVVTAIRTSQGRTHKHIIFWDEPDIGLSDEYAAGCGKKMAEFLKEPPEHLFAAFVVTHRKALIRQLVKLNPWHLRLGKEMTLQGWLSRRVVPVDPQNLKDEGLARLRRISKILDGVRAEKNKTR